MNINKNRTNTINLNQLIINIPVRRKIVDQNDRDKFEWNQVCIRVFDFDKNTNEKFLCFLSSGKVLQKRSILLKHHLKKNMFEVRKFKKISFISLH